MNVNNTIVGAGQLGIGEMLLINQAAGIIDANGVNALILSTGQQLINNTGLIELTGTASGNGGLDLYSSVVNLGGTIEANGANAHVDLYNTATVEGGTLAAAAGGVFNDINGAALDGNDYGPLTLNATFNVENNTNLFLYGTINNTGSIVENAGTNTTNIIVNSQAVTLTGGGHLVMGDSANNRLYGSNSSLQLVNVNNTISGAGQIGVGGLNLVNDAAGLIDATGTNSLTINTGSDLTFNTGTIESTSAGGLVLQNSAIDNAGGVVQAVGAGAHVDLSSGTVEGGTVAGTSGGVVNSYGGGLDGTSAGAITIVGAVNVVNGNALYLAGTINNTGSIVENAGTNTTDIRLTTQTVTLTGGGQLAMSNSANNRIFGNSNAAQTLDNVNNTISGAGQIGVGQMQLINAATILANASAGMTINTAGGNLQNTSTGLIESAGSGSIVFSSGVLSNQGTIEAAGGSSITLQSSVANTNVVSGELIGGTWEAIGFGSTLAIDGGTVTTLSANVLLQALGSTLETGNGSTFAVLENSLTTISSTGVLTLNNGRGYVTGLSLTDNGHINLSGVLQAGTLAVGSTGSIIGTGTVKNGFVNSGTVEALGGKLDLTKSVTGGGKMEIGASSTLELAIGAKQTAIFLSNTGTLQLDKPAGFVNQTIGGLQVGDTIDLVNTSVTSAVVNGSTLTVTETGGATLTYKVAGALAGNHFALQADTAHSGTSLVLTTGTAAPAAFGPKLAAIGQSTMLSEFTAPAAPSGGSASSAITTGGSPVYLADTTAPMVGFAHTH